MGLRTTRRDLLRVGVGIAALGTLGAGDAQASGGWRQFQATPDNLGWTTDSGPVDDAGARFQFDVGTPVRSSAAVVGERAYFGADDGYLYAVTVQGENRGERVWRYQVGSDGVVSSPAVVDGTVFVGGPDGAVHAVSAADGTRRWRTTVGDSVFSSPAVSDGTLYVGASGGGLVALSTADGSERWRANDGATTFASPAVAGGRVVVGFIDGSVQAFDATDGSRDWASSGSAPVFGGLTVANGTVFTGAVSGTLRALSLGDGSERWSVSTSGGSFSVGVHPERLRVVVGADQSIRAYTFAGEEVWRTDVGSGVVSSPAVTRDTAYVGSDDGRIHALSLSDGSVRWRFETGDQVFASPAVHLGVAYAGSMDGRFYALSNELIAAFDVEPPVPAPGESVTFDAGASTNGGSPIERYEWTFDGESATGETVTREFTGTGDHSVSLTVVNAEGNRDTRERTVRVVDPARTWHGYGRDPANTGFSPEATGPAEGAEAAWRRSVGGQVRDTPKVDNGTVFLADGTDVTVVGPDDEVQTRVEVGRPVEHVAVTADALVVTTGPEVHAYDRASGGQRWTTRFDREVVAPPTVADGIVYVGTTGGRVRALGLPAGQTRWRRSVDSALAHAVAVRDDRVHVATAGGQLYTYNATDGSEQWRHELESTAFTPTATANGVLVPSASGTLTAFDPTGTVRWREPVGSDASESVAVADGTAYVGTEGALVAYAAGDGTERWRASGPWTIRAAPAVGRERVYATTTEGDLLAFDRADGSRVVQTELGGSSGSPAVVEGRVYTRRDDGTVLALAEADATPAGESEPVTSTEGVTPGGGGVDGAQFDGSLSWAADLPPWSGIVAAAAIGGGALYARSRGEEDDPATPGAGPDLPEEDEFDVEEYAEGESGAGADEGAEPETEPESETGTDEGTEPVGEPAEPAPAASDLPSYGAPTTAIDGIGETYADRLSDAGVETVTDLAAADPGRLASLTSAAPATIDDWLAGAVGAALVAAGFESVAVDSTDGPLWQYEATLPSAPVDRVRVLTPASRVDTGAVTDDFVRVARQWRNVGTEAEIVDVFDHGEEPRPWVATERTRGVTLAERATDLTRAERADALASACDAIRNASRYNVTHLGVAPSNVYVTDLDGSSASVAVDDWGLERVVRRTTGELEPTPYTAPEQLDTDQFGPQGGHTDVYRLGATAYRVLTGDSPFSGEGAALADAIREGPPTPTDTDLPDAVVDAIRRSMRTEPDDRFASAYDLRQRLLAGIES